MFRAFFDFLRRLFSKPTPTPVPTPTPTPTPDPTPTPTPDPAPPPPSPTPPPPSGSPQRPTLFASYVTRPTVKMAGVDYYVGAPSNLKDPAMAAMPLGAEADTGNGKVTITRDNVVLDGFDFSRNGGWMVEATTGNNPVIQNNYWKIGARGYTPLNLMGEPNGYKGIGGTLLNNTFDGDGKSTGLAFLAHLSRSGAFKIQYNHFRNAFSDHMGWGGGGVNSTNEASYDCQFNLFENCGLAGGDSHPDIIQTFAGNKYGWITFCNNTVIEDKADGTQGLTFQGNTNTPFSTFAGGNVDNNAFILTIPAGRVNFVVGISKGLTTGQWTAQNNYFDVSSIDAKGAVLKNFQAGSLGGTAIASGNVNLKTGQVDPALNAFT